MPLAVSLLLGYNETMNLHRENMAPNVDLLLQRICQYNPESNGVLIRKAFDFAQKAHCDQLRKSGEPYFYHPFNVAMILASMQLDTTTIAAGLLHDTVEDCEVDLDDIKRRFGNTMAIVLEGVTKISKLSFKSREEFQAENLRKMLFAMVRDVRVILVKLADRLHNLRTIASLSSEKQKRIAMETLEIYVPLANRLGMYQIKSEMEDVSFQIAEPELANELELMIERNLEERRAYIEEVMHTIASECQKMGVEASISGRSKNLFSIYQKVRREDKRISEIYDLVGVRVTVQSLQDCYAVLGIVHHIWRPLPGRFKDYIAMPKMNMYQSLHTTVLHSHGMPVEVQIRTALMDRIAEDGIAAHWNYKEGRKTTEQVSQEIAWLRRLINWHRDLSDAQEYIETIKLELYRDEVFVFTPQGDVKALVAGATPLDFAYLVHTEVGNACVGAKVNGKIVTLDSQLKNGDIVEVLTSKTATPSKDWLKVVKSGHARHKLKAYFKNEERADDLKRGREILNKEWREMMKTILPFYEKAAIESPLQKENHDLVKVIRSDQFNKVLTELKYKALDDFLVRVGRGDGKLGTFFQKLFPEWAKSQECGERFLEAAKAKKVPKKSKRKSIQGIIVAGWDDMLVRFSKCCNPLPGDPIVGFITRGRGVSIHRKNCTLLAGKTCAQDAARFVEAEWDMEQIQHRKQMYVTKLRIEAIDRPSLLHDVTNLVHNLKLNIYELHAEARKNKLAIIEFSVEVLHVSMLPDLVKNFQKVDGVIRIRRISSNE